MGGIKITVIPDRGDPLVWGGRAMSVAEFLSLKDISHIPDGKADTHNGHVIFDAEARTMIINQEYFHMSATQIGFWQSIGFSVLTIHEKAKFNE